MTLHNGELEPNFIKLGEPRQLSVAEITELFGDPNLNSHPEELRHQRLNLASPTGETYDIHLGLPAEPSVGAYGAHKQYWPPYEPHVFTSDRFILRDEHDPNNLLVDKAGLRVLYMHGRWNGLAWVPSDHTLEQKGVTVPDILTSFESKTGWIVDVVWVCQFDTEGGQHKLSDTSSHPYIYPSSGYAHGAVTLERGQIEVSLYQGYEGYTKVEYEEWQLANS